VPRTSTNLTQRPTGRDAGTMLWASPPRRCWRAWRYVPPIKNLLRTAGMSPCGGADDVFHRIGLAAVPMSGSAGAFGPAKTLHQRATCVFSIHGAPDIRRRSAALDRVCLFPVRRVGRARVERAADQWKSLKPRSIGALLSEESGPWEKKQRPKGLTRTINRVQD